MANLLSTSVTGTVNSTGNMTAAGFTGNANVGGTGAATWHPSGIYCGSTMWQYGSQYKNNTGIYDVSEIKMYGGLYLQTYNDRNLIVKGNSSSDAGIEGRNAAGNNVFQIYGSGSDYGFLNGTWAGWDIRKTKNAAMYMNNDSTYYLQTNSTSNFYALNIQGNAVVHAGNIASQSVTYATTAGSAPNASNLNASYGVTAGAGNGLKFWNGNDTYKISMGNSDEYHYGPVTDYSIKTVIDSVGATRGFTWGVNGGTPIAALNVGNGNMQIAGTFTASNFSGSSSGTNTGDQTNISGNAATATTASNLAANTSPTIRVLNFSGVGSNSGNANQSYAIYQEGGEWSPPFPDLCIGYHTGIKLGAYFGYNGTRFYNNSDFATQTFSVNDGDNHVRVAYNLYVGGTISGSNLSGTNTGDQTNISGNAATVTNGLYTNNYSGTLDGRYFFDYGFTTGYPGTEANAMPGNRSAFTYSNGAPLTGCIAHFGASGYGIQLNGDYQGDSFSMRSRNGDAGTWRPWKRLITDYNYTSYVPTLTGSGASGTWSINVTGSAGTAARATRANGNFYIDDNYGNTVVGVYSASRLQGVFAMGDAYKLAADGSGASNHYGIAWSHPNHGGTAARLTNHGMLIQGAGSTWAAISDSIWCIGDITAFSDARVKTNIEVIDNPLERLSKVRGVTFTRIDLADPTKRYAGVIAQEMREALPEVVTEDGNGELSVSYGNTVSLLIESIKAQQAQIEELKLEVKKLKGE